MRCFFLLLFLVTSYASAATYIVPSGGGTQTSITDGNNTVTTVGGITLTATGTNAVAVNAAGTQVNTGPLTLVSQVDGSVSGASQSNMKYNGTGFRFSKEGVAYQYLPDTISATGTISGLSLTSTNVGGTVTLTLGGAITGLAESSITNLTTDLAAKVAASGGTLTGGTLAGTTALTGTLSNLITSGSAIVNGTFTDASNYRRGVVKASTAGVTTISSEGLGTGASGNTLKLQTNGSDAITIDGSQQVSFTPNGSGVISMVNNNGSALSNTLSLTNNNAVASGGFINSVYALAPNMATGSHFGITFGKSAATNNVATFGFTYAANNSVSNLFDVYFYGQPNPALSVSAAGNMTLSGSSIVLTSTSAAGANNSIYNDGTHLYWKDGSGTQHQLDN